MPPEADAAEIFAYLLVSNSDKLEQQMIAALSAFNEHNPKHVEYDSDRDHGMYLARLIAGSLYALRNLYQADQAERIQALSLRELSACTGLSLDGFKDYVSAFNEYVDGQYARGRVDG